MEFLPGGVRFALSFPKAYLMDPPNGTLTPNVTTSMSFLKV